MNSNVGLVGSLILAHRFPAPKTREILFLGLIFEICLAYLESERSSIVYALHRINLNILHHDASQLS